MSKKNQEKHLDVYNNRCELFQNDEKSTYYEGYQSEETIERYKHINKTLESGYLDKKISALNSADFAGLSGYNQTLLRNLVNGMTSEVGRALVGLTFLQLTIKSIEPNQSIRLHKGTTRQGSFSWKEGISMRTIDANFNTPFLRKNGLLNLNKYGVFMTRSLAENYPYSSLYKAEMKGPFDDWITIVDAIEDLSLPSGPGLSYMIALLKNRSDNFQKDAKTACDLVREKSHYSFAESRDLLVRFFNTTDYSARAFEVVMHALFQAMKQDGYLDDLTVIPLSQMRSANKKHGNIGDIELAEDGIIIESWDAKYGKPYLRDELEELRDKIITNPDVKIAGFVVDANADMRADIKQRIKEISLETGTTIYILSFSEWLIFELHGLSTKQLDELGNKWLIAVVESFAQKRLQIAPIDEPCDKWIDDLIMLLK